MKKSASKNIILAQKFFNRSALRVARDLLGKVIVRSVDGKKIIGIITEVEAYTGTQDKACHAHRGCTPRTQVMFGPAGKWYVYLCYGMHWMCNIVTGKEGDASAVLIRGVARDDGHDFCDCNGPGKFTKTFHIDQSLNNKVANRKSGLWIEDRHIIVPPRTVTRASRIGVAYAGEWAHKPYRFIWEWKEKDLL